MSELCQAAGETKSGVEQIECQVRGQLNGRVREMRVLWNGNGLVLRGRAQSYYAKQLAQHLVMLLSALPLVANEIEVT